MILSMSDLGQASVDQVITQQTLLRAIDDLAIDVRDYKAEHSGFAAVVERLRGSPDMAPLNAAVEALRTRISAASLPDTTKTDLSARLDKVASTLQPADMKILLIGGGIFLGVKVLSAAGSAAASYAAEKAKARFVKPKTKKKRGAKKRAAVESTGSDPR